MRARSAALRYRIIREREIGKSRGERLTSGTKIAQISHRSAALVSDYNGRDDDVAERVARGSRKVGRCDYCVCTVLFFSR